MRTIAEEIKRAQSTGVQTKAKFEVQIRDVELNYIQDGDILLIPETYTVIPQKMRGIAEPVEMIYIEALRNGSKVVVPFYPSIFWKSRRVCDENNKPTDVYKRSTGEVVDFVQDFGDLNEALVSIAKNHPKGILVKMEQIKSLRYGEPEDGTGRARTENIPTLTWAA